MQNLAVDVHRAGADRLAVHPGQEGANVLGRYCAQLVPRERAHDPRSSLLGTICLWPGEHGPVAVEGGGLGSLLELQVLQPDLNRVLEARLPHPRSDLLLRFDLGDHLAHLHVGAALVQEALAHATSPPPPAAFSVGLEPGPSQAALALRSRRVPPLHFVEGLVLVGVHAQGANGSPVASIVVSSSSLRRHGPCPATPAFAPGLGTNAAETRAIETYVPALKLCLNMSICRHNGFLSRRRSRVRVPSLPLDEVPALRLHFGSRERPFSRPLEPKNRPPCAINAQSFSLSSPSELRLWPCYPCTSG